MAPGVHKTVLIPFSWHQTSLRLSHTDPFPQPIDTFEGLYLSLYLFSTDFPSQNLHSISSALWICCQKVWWFFWFCFSRHVKSLFSNLNLSGFGEVSNNCFYRTGFICLLIFWSCHSLEEFHRSPGGITAISSTASWLKTGLRPSQKLELLYNRAKNIKPRSARAPCRVRGCFCPF